MASVQPWEKNVKINNELSHLIQVLSFSLFLKKNSHWTLKILANIFPTSCAFCLRRRASFQSENTYIQIDVCVFLAKCSYCATRPAKETRGGASSGAGVEAVLGGGQGKDAGAFGEVVAWKPVSPSIPPFSSSCHQGTAACEMTRLSPTHPSSGGSWKIPLHPHKVSWLPLSAQSLKVQANWMGGTIPPPFSTGTVKMYFIQVIGTELAGSWGAAPSRTGVFVKSRLQTSWPCTPKMSREWPPRV